MTTRDSGLPFTVQLADDGSDPIEIHDHLTSLRMSVIQEGTVGALDEDAWNVPGAHESAIYVGPGVPGSGEWEFIEVHCLPWILDKTPPMD
ncbi:hypothetical protein [Georgenia muralis]|uniref:Uncharacterized protein n=1 Tax=Georgenia muralis TaxID=154117 RepID=A0A3N4Z957_9MICO|nr:hypothetical protein [Georgenia muralis]RPF28564.1 hypothetical protein EDD32_3097 [Georgenia muralis]